MTTPAITATLLAELPGAPTLIVGPSLGTSVASLWGPALPYLGEHFQVLGWDLPGHGASAASGEAFTIPELADAVADVIRSSREAGVIAAGVPVIVAGDSIGGGTTLQVALDHADLIDGAVSVCAAATFGTPDAWHDRADLVRQAGTPTQVAGSSQRWFAEGFIEREKVIAAALLHDLQNADRFAYAAACLALADFDLRDRLDEIRVPVLAIGGAEDPVCAPREQRRIAESVQSGRYVIVPGAAHQAPAEAPEATARAIVDAFAEGEPAASGSRAVATGAPAAAGVTGEPAAAGATVAPAAADTGAPAAADTGASAEAIAADARARAGVPIDDTYDAGMAVRREVLGGNHVDRSTASIDDVTRDFQALITRYAWGTVWTRPGLTRETRSAITQTAMIAGGFWDEYDMHVRAALRIGLSRDEIVEIALHSSIYCAVPAANHALGIVKRVFAEPDPTA